MNGKTMSIIQTVRFSLLTDRLYKVSRWKLQRVERLQQKRLRRLVSLAVERSPYYRAKYRGIDVNSVELSQLPPTGKEELMANFDSALTDPQIRRTDVEKFMADPANLGRWFLDRYAISHTSGTQGSPSLIVQDRRSLEILFAMMSSRANASGKPGLIEGFRRLRSPFRVAIVSMDRGFYPSGAAFEFMPELVGRFVNVLRLSSMQNDLIGRLNEFQPNALVSYATVLETLALQSNRLRLSDLRQIANSSEQLTKHARDRVRKAFGVPVFDHYGLGECLFLSDGCPTDGGAHVNADWAILEVVDEHYRPVPDGQLGQKVLITNLANTVQPFIRYEVGDCLAMAEGPCRCGSRLPRIDCIKGRSAELFWIHDGNQYRFVANPLFQIAADSLNEIREWQAVQLERNRIEVLLQLLPNVALRPETLRHEFNKKLNEYGLPEKVTIDVRIVPSFASDPKTGKFRRMISHVGQPADLVV
jgi:phenylacetate-CoA ligase